jgi:xanthine dehydrogenase YagT iron-sulfur-binding subunit
VGPGDQIRESSHRDMLAAVQHHPCVTRKDVPVSVRERGGALERFPADTIGHRCVMDVPVRLTVNGMVHALTLDARVTLLDTLRDHVGLTGSKKACDRGQCGSCTVLVDGRRIVSCLTLAVASDERDVTTIEGLAGEDLHPLQRSFVDHDALQCGYCTPGQVCSAVGMLAEVAEGWPSAVTPLGTERPTLDEAEVRERMSGNLCRCGAYVNIVAAIIGAGPP